MVIGVVMALAGLTMIYLAVTNVPLGDVARQIAKGQVVTIPRVK